MTTRIYRPTAAEVDAVCELLMIRSKGEAKRYIRAGEIVLSGAIEFDDATGWTVASQSKPGSKTPARYSLKPGACTCYDFIHHGGVSCKHLDALAIYMRVIATRLDTSLRTPAAIEAAAEAVGWRMLAELGPDDAAAYADYLASQPADRRLEMLPGDAPHRGNVYDRRTHAGICVAQAQPGGAWRPCTPMDTVAWVRWLGAQQPAEVEPVEAVMVPELAPDSDGSELFSNTMPHFAESPYKYDQRQALKGRAPVLQMQHDANERRRQAQADAKMIDELDRQFAR